MSDASVDRLVELDEATCRQLLASHHIGRVAFNDDPAPQVLPVNYVVRDNRVVFHTGEGVKHAAAEQRVCASFQVDGVNTERGSAWSVLLHGRLEPGDDIESADEPIPLPGGDRMYVVVLSIDAIAGRRVPPEQGWVLSGRSWRGTDASDLMG